MPRPMAWSRWRGQLVRAQFLAFHVAVVSPLFGYSLEVDGSGSPRGWFIAQGK